MIRERNAERQLELSDKFRHVLCFLGFGGVA